MFPARNRLVRLALFLSIFLLVFLPACAAMSGASPTQAPAYRAAGGMPAAAPPAPEAAPAPAMDSSAKQSSANTASTGSNSQPRIIIKNGNMAIVVVDPAKTVSDISHLADGMGGFVVSSSLYKQQTSSGAEAPHGSIVIRVPAGRLDEAIQQIRAMSNQGPLNENISSQDVTSEYVDLQSRLKNLEAAEAQLTKIMEGAVKTEDVLSVYNQLVQTREQIEVIKGQIKYYEESAALSELSIELFADAAVQPLQIGGWQPGGVAKQAIEALIATLQGLGSALIWIIIYVLPILLLLFVIFILPPLLILRWWLHRRSRRKAAVAAQKGLAPPAPPAS
jgi:hypothetical protein